MCVHKGNELFWWSYCLLNLLYIHRRHSSIFGSKIVGTPVNKAMVLCQIPFESDAKAAPVTGIHTFLACRGFLWSSLLFRIADN